MVFHPGPGERVLAGRSGSPRSREDRVHNTPGSVPVRENALWPLQCPGLGNQVNDFLLVYLDDVVVFSPCFDSHLDHLEQVFERLQGYGLKLQPHKCHFLRREVRYLGHVVSGRGVATNPEKTAAVKEWPDPSKAGAVISGFRRLLPEVYPGLLEDSHPSPSPARRHDRSQVCCCSVDRGLSVGL